MGAVGYALAAAELRAQLDRGGLPSPDGLAAAGQAMRTEGLMLDPVYTAKALALAPARQPVVFWHTGGALDAVAAAQEAAS
ncbi:MAG TPA: hypothetical protein VMK84_22270 [Streptosporangiaceae bacterium]|nr:hypothetical protein [Streptosporangiaceae bacterium]